MLIFQLFFTFFLRCITLNGMPKFIMPRLDKFWKANIMQCYLSPVIFCSATKENYKRGCVWFCGLVRGAGMGSNIAKRSETFSLVTASPRRKINSKSEATHKATLNSGFENFAQQLIIYLSSLFIFIIQSFNPLGYRYFSVHFATQSIARGIAFSNSVIQSLNH